MRPVPTTTPFTVGHVELLGDEFNKLAGHFTVGPSFQEIVCVETSARMADCRITYGPRHGGVVCCGFSDRKVHRCLRERFVQVLVVTKRAFWP